MLLYPGLTITTGKLSLLPLELRNQIYELVLDFESGYYYGVPHVEHRAALLRTSKAIFDEAIKIMVNVNHFSIDVSIPDQLDVKDDDKAEVGSWKWTLSPGFRSNTGDFSREAQDAFVRRGLLKEIRFIIDFDVGYVYDSDIIMDQNSKQAHLLPLLDGVITELRNGALKSFYCSIDSMEEEPGNIGLILDLLGTLRGLKSVNLWLYMPMRLKKTKIAGWQVKKEYAAHLESVMKLPKGVEAPKWVPGI